MKNIQLGLTAKITRIFTAEGVALYASLVGAYNPFYLDYDYALKTRFGKCIVHGMLTAGLLSAVFSEVLPS